jgi:hypothetical protein
MQAIAPARRAMTEKPTTRSVGARLREFKRIGREAFLTKYASGFGARAYYIRDGGRLYDMKAVWAAAHDPPAWSGGFNTSEPLAELPRLGFQRVSAKDLSRSERTQLRRTNDEEANTALDRDRAKKLERLFRKLWPSASTRHALAECLARSVQHANKCASGSWV